MAVQGAYMLFVTVSAACWLGFQVAAQEGVCDSQKIGLLENMTTTLTASRKDGITFKDETKEAIKELSHQLQVLASKQDEYRQEQISQHEEMMYIFHQMLDTMVNTEDQKLSEASDCSIHYNAGKRKSGIYRIKPFNLDYKFDVYCEMELQGGGWTMIQRRGSFGTPMDYFNKTGVFYQRGFGELEKEFWLGNDRISALSRQEPYELLIDLKDYSNRESQANYKSFQVGNVNTGYMLDIGKFSGTTYDGMTRSSGKFSALDVDNDFMSGNCAASIRGPWWHFDCTSTGLNGRRDPDKNGLVWISSNGTTTRMSAVAMMIRPNNFVANT